MATSKTNVEARKEAKKREKFFGSCGHEVRPVRLDRNMAWHCEQCSSYAKKWVSRG